MEFEFVFLLLAVCFVHGATPKNPVMPSPQYSYVATMTTPLNDPSTWILPNTKTWVGAAQVRQWSEKHFVDEKNLGQASVWNYDVDRIVWRYDLKKRQNYGQQYCAQGTFTETPTEWSWIPQATFDRYDSITRSWTLYCEVWIGTDSDGYHELWVTYNGNPSGKALPVREYFTTANPSVRKSWTKEYMSIGIGQPDTRAFTLAGSCNTYTSANKQCVGDGCGNVCFGNESGSCPQKRDEGEEEVVEIEDKPMVTPEKIEFDYHAENVINLGWNPSQTTWRPDVDALPEEWK